VPASLRTNPSTRRLSEVARHVVMPSGIVTTGWPAIESQCAEWGDEFDEWQRNLGQIVLGKRVDGIYAATIGGVTLSIPRQVAKTFLVGRIIFGLCARFPGTRVLWTAHRTRTSTMTFRNMIGLADRPKVKPYIGDIRRVNGEQEIHFVNGSVIMFGAREGGFGRGFDEIDVEVFDEAQILTDKALEDMLAATNQSRHPHGALIFYMGTPPRPVDPGEVITGRRAEALSGESDDLVYVECSADQDAGLDDHDQWRIANPSFPHRTPLRSMLRLRKQLRNDDSWRREGLGIWDQTSGVIPTWPTLKRDPAESVIVSNQSWAISLSPADASDLWAAVGKAGRTADGTVTVQTVKHDVGVSWVLPLVVDLYKQKPIPVRVGPGPERSLVPALIEAGVEVVEVSAPDASAATTRLVSGTKTTVHEPDDDHPESWIEPPSVFHIGQASLTRSVENAKLARSSDGSVKWDRRGDVDITPLQAVTVALTGVSVADVPAVSQIW